MARARNIKPGFFQNEDLVELTFEIRLLFIGLWTIADRQGRLDDRPKKIKMQLFPADNIDVDDALNKLQESGFIIRYSVDNSNYIQIVTFNKHQNPHKNEADSSIPAPELHSTSTVQAQDKHSSARADSLIPDSLNSDSNNSLSNAGIENSFEPENKKALIAKYPTLDLETEKQKFIAHYEANGSERRNWQAQFRKWLLDAQQMKADASQRSPPVSGNKKPYAAEQSNRKDHSGQPTVSAA